MNYMDFEAFNEARYTALWSLDECCRELCISIKTLYRWKSKGFVPLWAYRATVRASGDLSVFDWPSWYIEKGILYNRQLSKKHNWTPKDIILPLYSIKPDINQKLIPSYVVSIDAAKH